MMPRPKLLWMTMCLSSILILTGCGKSGKPDPKVGDKPLSAWAAQLQDKNPETRTAAAKALGELGAAAKPAAPELAAAVKTSMWEIALVDLEMAELPSTFTVVGQSLGVPVPQTPEQQEKARKEAEKFEAEQKKAREKRKPLEDRQKKEEAAVLATLNALEKIDPAELAKLGLGDGKLAKLRELTSKRGQYQTFETVGNTIGGPAK